MLRYVGLLVLAAPVLPFALVHARRKKRTPDPDQVALERVIARIHRGPVTLLPEEEVALREVLAFVSDREALPDHVQWAIRRLREVEARCAV